MKRDRKLCLLIFLAAVLVYIQGLNWLSIEYRDDEIFYYRAADEMLAQQNYFSPTYFGENRFEKPILFYWFIMFFYKVFGVGWFSARITSVILAGLTLAVTWLIGRDLLGRRSAWMGTLILAAIPMFFRHAKEAVPDMPLNFFIVAAVYAGIRFSRDPRERTAQILFFVLCGLGFMIKGYAALIVPWLTVIVALIWQKRAGILRKLNFPLGLLIVLAIVAPWFIYMLNLHGRAYFDFMLVHETKNRLMVASPTPFYIEIFQTFVHNLIFYGTVLRNYFSPWCFFFLPAMVWAGWRIRSSQPDREGLIWICAWLGVVVGFFCLVKVIISHYMLVLSAPFALLTGHFLVAGARFAPGWRRAIKGFFLVLLALGAFGLCILHIILAGGHPAWAILYLSAAAVILPVLVRHGQPAVAAAAFGLLTLGVFAQTGLFVKAGISAHSAYQRIAGVIHNRMTPDSVIGVASHDLHEKELQAYFDRPLAKAGRSNEALSRKLLKNLLDMPQDVYFVVIQKDFDHYRAMYDEHHCSVIREDMIIRKRMRIDFGFWGAILKLDRGRIDEYLKEKVLIVHKPENV